MIIAIESLLFLLAGIVLTVVLTRVLGRSSDAPPGSAVVELVRSSRTADGREETRLVINGTVILMASNDGIRLAEYADEVERLEAVAARIAASLGVTVAFSRIPSRETDPNNGLSMRGMPPLNADDIEAAPRPRRMDRGQGGG